MGIDLNKTEETVECRLKITEEMKENLLKATKWIKFINIVGCISMGFLAIVGFIAIFGDLWMVIEEQEVVFLWV